MSKYIPLLSADDIVFSTADGLIPAVIQDHRTRQVLMLGYMNRRALEQTIETGFVTFFSRSKKRLWMKGEESGNTLKVIWIQKDCDRDALLIAADPAGPTCHTGHTSCFHDYDGEPEATGTEATTADIMAHPGLFFLPELERLLIQRKTELPEGSYTSKMFRSGRDKLAQKVGEEAVETVIASKNNREELLYEASDLLFHLMMLLVHEEITLQDLDDELARRHKPEKKNPEGNKPKGQNPGTQSPDANKKGQNPETQNPEGNKPKGQNPGTQSPDANKPAGRNPETHQPGK